MANLSLLIATGEFRCFHCTKAIEKGSQFLELGKLCFHPGCYLQHDAQKVINAQLQESLKAIFEQQGVCWILDHLTEFMREQSGLTDPERYDKGELSEEDCDKEEKIRLVEQCAQDLGEAGGW
jgi:hypothetical protein